MRPRPTVYLFGWPSGYGGAGTKVRDLLGLMAGECRWVVVPNEDSQLKERGWVRWMKEMDIKVARWSDLPRRLRGWGLGICNGPWLLNGRAIEARVRGLRLIWSSEMMWHHPAELGAVAAGILDTVLYVSDVQREALEPGYWRAAGLMTKGAGSGVAEQGGGTFVCRYGGHGLDGSGMSRLLVGHMVGNYVDPEGFPWRDRTRRRFPGEVVIGRLSRSDPAKFFHDFPRWYERLGVRNARFRVMAWSDALAERWKGHSFDWRWDFLPALAESPRRFLESLDLFVYGLGRGCRESWGRAVVEGMLSGVVPVVEGDERHHLCRLFPHGVAGFHFNSRVECRGIVKELARNGEMRARFSRTAGEYAREVLCNPHEHRERWRAVFEG